MGGLEEGCEWWVCQGPRAVSHGDVFIAERVTSLGKDWHRPCLKCEKCGKTLTSGGHAEVGGLWDAGRGILAGAEAATQGLFSAA